jgi:hypothetical protein
MDRWQKTIAAVRAIGGEADEIRIGPPATEAEIAATERKIRRRLPPSFRRFLLEFSGSVSVGWRTPRDDPESLSEGIGAAIQRRLEEQFGVREVDPLRRLPKGEVSLGLDIVELAERVRRERCEALRRRLRGRAEDESLLRWSRSIAWQQQDNQGVAFDPDDSGAVVLLDNNELVWDSTAWLAPDFMDFMDRWSRIGGAKPYYMAKLPRKPWGGLDPDCDLARMWRAALHVDL